MVILLLVFSVICENVSSLDLVKMNIYHGFPIRFSVSQTRAGLKFSLDWLVLQSAPAYNREMLVVWLLNP